MNKLVEVIGRVLGIRGNVGTVIAIVRSERF